jgi:hypothetical protein
MPIDKPNARYKHLYAVLRIDIPVHPDHPESSITVVKVFASKESAEEETARLNRINAEKNCNYHMQITRMPIIN